MRKEYIQLVKQLKRAKRYFEIDEIRTISMQLAAIPDESAHRELYRMAKPSWCWFTMGFVEDHITRDCQTIAYKVLAETGTKRAIDFLTSSLAAKRHRAAVERERAAIEEEGEANFDTSGYDHYMMMDYVGEIRGRQADREFRRRVVEETLSTLEICAEKARETYEQKQQQATMDRK